MESRIRDPSHSPTPWNDQRFGALVPTFIGFAYSRTWVAWPSMTNSKYKVEQSYSNVLSEEGRFEGFASYEWSGDAAGRRRYGDRTVVFTKPFSPIYRITDPESNSIEELRELLAGDNAIPWVHHVGAPWGAMDWSKHDETFEPVVEVTSGHGVYETYDRSRAVPD